MKADSLKSFINRLNLNFHQQPERNAQLALKVYNKCLSFGLTENEFLRAVEKFFDAQNYPNWTEADFMKCVTKFEKLRYVPVWFEELPDGAIFQRNGKAYTKEGEMCFFVDNKNRKFYVQPETFQG